MTKNEKIKLEQRRIQTIKNQLPTVKIRVAGKTITGQIKGRLLPFAQVVYTHRQTPFTAEYSWNAIARAVYEKRTLAL